MAAHAGLQSQQIKIDTSQLESKYNMMSSSGNQTLVVGLFIRICNVFACFCKHVCRDMESTRRVKCVFHCACNVFGHS